MILALIVWLALDEWPGAARAAGRQATPAIKRMAVLIVALVVTQIVLGAFVAGLKAGLIYNTWPTMDGQWVPSNYWTTPAYLSFFESHAAAQFNHRIMGYLVGLAVLTELWFVMRSPVDATDTHNRRTSRVCGHCADIAWDCDAALARSDRSGAAASRRRRARANSRSRAPARDAKGWCCGRVVSLLKQPRIRSDTRNRQRLEPWMAASRAAMT